MYSAASALPVIEYYQATFQQALAVSNFKLVAELVLLPGLKRSSNEIVGQLQGQVPKGSISKPNFNSPYDELYMLHVQALSMPSDLEHLLKKYELSSQAIQLFIKHLGSLEDNKELAVLKSLAYNLYSLARQTDHLLLANKRTADKCKDCARTLSRCFTLTITDRAPLPQSKKWAALCIVVLLFRLYFKLNTLRLCGNILRALDNPQMEFPQLSAFPKSESATYFYFRGRIALNAGEFRAAEEHFSQALKICQPSDFSHGREILSYLIVLKMIYGKLPCSSLLERFSLKAEYEELTMAVRTGNIQLFDHALGRNQAFYLGKELFLLIQVQLKGLILRNFFKKIYTIGVKSAASVEFRLPLANIVLAFKMVGVVLTIEEIECWVANLIYDGFIRGYISHEKNIVVLSKKNPFPPPYTLA